MNTKLNLFITGIPLDLTSNDLKELFNEFGKVLSARVVKPQSREHRELYAEHELHRKGV